MNVEKRFGYGERQYFGTGNESGGAGSYCSDRVPATLGVFAHNRWYEPTYRSCAVADQDTADNTLVRAMLACLRREGVLWK